MKNIWKTTCFKLNKNPTIDESKYELLIIELFEKLGYEEINGEIVIQKNIPIGSNNSLKPDLIIKNQFVVEIKKPSENIENEKYKSQLFSYMRQSKFKTGILIGGSILVYYDTDDNKDPALVQKIQINENSKYGVRFLELFKKGNFDNDLILKLLNQKQEKIELKNLIFSQEFRVELKEIIKQHLTLKNYTVNLIDEVVDDVNFEIIPKSNTAKNDNKQNELLKVNQKPKNKDFANTDEEEIKKIEKRVPEWFKKPGQINSKILLAFFEIQENYTTNTKKLKEKSGITKFSTNFNQMKNFGEKNHGKVFDEKNDIVGLWNPVKDFIIGEYEKYNK
jgi:hypothetical protein